MAEEKKEESKEEEMVQAPAGFKTLLGRKVGCSRLFTEAGEIKAVTVIEAGPCRVLRVKGSEGKDGYSAVLLGFGGRSEKNVSLPDAGQFKAAGVKPLRFTREIRVADSREFKAGQVVALGARFAIGDFVDLQGVSKGRGFGSAIARHGFAGLGRSHGTSDKERSPGSLTARRSLGRVLPGKRMAGRIGGLTTTVDKVEVVRVEAEKNLLYVNGSVPGARGSFVTIRETGKPQKRRKVVEKKTGPMSAAQLMKLNKAKGMKGKK